MAIYHDNLMYHEDAVCKHFLSREDRAFLKELQKELNTQDTCGTRDPRFWVIKGTKEEYATEENMDGCMFLQGGEVIASDEKEFVSYVNENILSQEEYSLDVEECFFENIFSVTNKNGFEEEYTAYTICEWLNGKYASDITYFPYENKSVIYPNTFFLTEKDAADHLRAFHHRYSDDAHTYCCSAQESPRVEKLLRILQETNWDE